MFKDCQYNGTVGKYHYRYTIIDTHFEEVVVVPVIGMLGIGYQRMPVIILGGAVIDCYTKRGISVAPNLFRYMMFFRRTWGYSFDEQVKWHEQYVPQWDEVKQHMQMYLMMS